MRREIGVVLALSLCAGCASDFWYKRGADTEALAQDKAACSAEVAQLPGARASEAFEQCMSARDWLHVGSSRRRSAPARKVRSAASVSERPVAPAIAATPSALAPASPTRPEAPPVDAASPAESRAAADTTVAQPAATPESDARELPSVDAAPPAPDLEEEQAADEELEETALAPEPIDPKARQFWVKLGAGPTQLQADQKSCRRELGVLDTETQPSRWGQSDAFDTCMRARGWGGGSIQVTP